MTTIRISDYVTLNQGVTPDEGEPIKAAIDKAFKNGDNVILDFENITLMTTAFLNVVIGALYKDYTSEELKSMLDFSNITPDIAKRIKKVTDTAKLFYSDMSKFESTVKKVLDGND